MTETFSGNFTQQEPIPEAGIAAATEVLRGGRLHRYNLGPGEAGEVAALEAEYAAWQGRRYCLALASGGQAMQIALRAAGVAPGDAVLSNAFTLAPVPGAIAAVGARAVLVDINADLRIDLDDLARKATASGAKVLLLSLMRGHVGDMEALADLCAQLDLTMIEDCAHTMGATWNGVRSGNFGLAGCFSTQTYKHMNSGEGGLLCADDADFMARATILSGSYMNYTKHGAGPQEGAFDDARLDMPNLSARMDALRAAILRAQLPLLDENIARWNARYEAVADELRRSNRIVQPLRPEPEGMVGSSIQFRVPTLDAAGCDAFVKACAARGVELKWFGRAEPVGFTSAHRSWRYVTAQDVPQTDTVLATLFDMRLPLTFARAECQLIGRIIVDVADTAA